MFRAERCHSSVTNPLDGETKYARIQGQPQRSAVPRESSLRGRFSWITRRARGRRIWPKGPSTARRYRRPAFVSISAEGSKAVVT
jgi:hypothetical protein